MKLAVLGDNGPRTGNNPIDSLVRGSLPVPRMAYAVSGTDVTVSDKGNRLFNVNICIDGSNNLLD
jgi:hypothetical protein